MDVGRISDVLCLEKDVDGFHPINIGNLAMRGREPLFIPCTPKGCIELLIRSGIDVMGKKAVVIGRSNIVGLPASLLLQVIRDSIEILIIWLIETILKLSMLICVLTLFCRGITLRLVWCTL